MIADIIIWIIVFLVSAIPLHISVKLLGGRTSLLKTALIAFLAGIITVAIENYFSIFGSIFAFIVLIWIYHEAFRLKWLKSFFAWILQFVVIAIIFFILGLLGFGLAAISFL